ncbi:MAG: hypothetical protein AB1Z23_11760 [Eubacteriales bacterium]
MKRIVKRILYKSLSIYLAFIFIIDYSVQGVEMDKYKENTDLMYEWLIGTQLSNGALPVYGEESGEASIVPYFSSIAVLAILEYADEQSSIETAREYFDWHFGRINMEQGDDFATIYDYTAAIKNREVTKENSKKSYDSADSYAALFLAALWKYAEKTGDDQYILDNSEKINSILDLQIVLIDDDGLSFVSRKNETKYLMDNCEVYFGLLAANKLLGEVFLKQHNFFSKEYWRILKQMSEIKNARKKMAQAIERLLWDEEKQFYDIGISSNGEKIKFKNYDDFYPDAIAQIFPIVFGIINPDSPKAKNIYRRFSNAHKWEDLAHYKDKKTNFYWGIGAYCGAMMGDEDKVERYTDSFMELAMPDFGYPAYNADVAWTIMAYSYK